MCFERPFFDVFLGQNRVFKAFLEVFRGVARKMETKIGIC